MKIMLVPIFVFLIMLLGEPLAPVIKVPNNPDNDPEIALAIQFIESVQVPDKDKVEISAYPGSEIFQTTKIMDDMLPTVRLITRDQVEVVLGFYKKELGDWKYKENYGIHMFYTNDEMKAMFGQEPVVQIEPADQFINIWPDARTVILIGYE